MTRTEPACRPSATAAEPCLCADRLDVAAVVARYATSLDQRDWDGLAEVFAAEAVGEYGGVRVEGIAALQRWCRRFLGSCGPSQHLLGPVVVQVNANTAAARTDARVIHLGAGDRASLPPYEAIGTYTDRLVRTAAGWRITHRTFDVRIETGDRAVLGPA